MLRIHMMWPPLLEVCSVSDTFCLWMLLFCLADWGW